MVLRYVRMDVYYLTLEIESDYVSLVKYYYNNRMVLERKHCPSLAPLGHWNRLLITLSGQLVQVLLVQNTPLVVLSRTVPEDSLVNNCT